jgi:hypothetical protein
MIGLPTQYKDSPSSPSSSSPSKNNNNELKPKKMKLQSKKLKRKKKSVIFTSPSKDIMENHVKEQTISESDIITEEISEIQSMMTSSHDEISLSIINENDPLIDINIITTNSNDNDESLLKEFALDPNNQQKLYDDIICPYDAIIFLGDFNYRLDIPRLEVSQNVIDR